MLADPRATASQADYRAQFDFLIRIRDKLSEVHRSIGKIRDVHKQITSLENRLEGQATFEPVLTAAEKLKEELTSVEEALYQTKLQSPQDPLNFPIRLNDKLAGLLGLAGIGDYPPTESLEKVRQELSEAIDEQMRAFRGLLDDRLAHFNRLARDHEVDAVIVFADD